MTSEQIKSLYGRNVEARRKLLDMTQTELAEKIGVSMATISRIEAGLQGPSAENLSTLSVALQATPDDLLRVDAVFLQTIS